MKLKDFRKLCKNENIKAKIRHGNACYWLSDLLDINTGKSIIYLKQYDSRTDETSFCVYDQYQNLQCIKQGIRFEL